MQAALKQISELPHMKQIGLKSSDAVATEVITRVVPTKEEAERAVRTLIGFACDDPERQGVLDTPARVTKAYGEFFAGYHENPGDILSKEFEEIEGYDDLV